MTHPIINPQTYLKDLIDYAILHIKITTEDGEEELTIQDLETRFHQPFSQLLELDIENDVELPQIQLCMETLRKHLGNRPLDNAELEQALAGSEADYWEMAYQSILIYLGVSVEELANANDENRQKLAGRLGVLTTRLQELPIDSGEVNEAFLKTIFGLADSNNPVISSDQEPAFILWRKEQIEGRATQLFNPEETEEKAKWMKEQIEQAKEVLFTVRGKVEGLVFPILRSALITALEEEPRRLGEKLLIDCEYAPDFKISRIWQAISSLQEMMHSMRTGLLKDTQADLVFEAPDYLKEWRWLGAFNNWKAAMGIWLYPENLLAPNLEKERSPVFHRLLADLRKTRRLKPEAAMEYIQEYEDYFKDICNLKIEATCEARLENNPAGISDESMLFQFGRSNSEKPYYALTKDDGQAYWQSIPGLEGFGVSKIIGAAVYEFSENKRMLYLFFQGQVKLFQKPGNLQSVFSTGSDSVEITPPHKAAIAYTIYDLQEGKWNEQYDVLLKEMSSTSKVLLEQRVDLSRPPQFIFLDTSGVRYKKFEFEENGWTKKYEDFPIIIPGQSISDIFSFLFINGKSRILFKSSSGGILRIVTFQEGIENADNHFYRHVYDNSADFAGLLFRSDLHLWCILRQENDLIRVHIHFENENITISAPLGEPFLFNTKKIIFHGGTKRDPNAIAGVSEIFYWPRYVVESIDSGNYLFAKHRHPVDHFKAISLRQILPKEVEFFDLAPDRIQVDLQKRREGIKNAMENNEGAPIHIQTYLWEAFFQLPLYLASRLRQSRFFTEAIDYLRLIYDYTLPSENRKIFYGLIQEADLFPKYEQAEDWYLNPLDPHYVARIRPNAYTKYILLTLANLFLENGDVEFSRDTMESINTAKLHYTTALEILETTELNQSPGQWVNEVEIPINPLIQSMMVHAELSLFKIHTGRNIAGEERPVQPPLAGSASQNGLFNSNLNLPNNISQPVLIRPIAHRYVVLIERAKQLANLAQQMEAAYLSAMEKLEAEQLNLLNAKNDMELSKATVRLQDLRIKEALDGLRLAEMQKRRHEIQLEYFSDLLSTGLLELEEKALRSMQSSSILGTLGGFAGAIVAGAAAAATGGAALAILAVGGGVASTLSQTASSNAEYNLTKANFERRRQEWAFQNNLAMQDVQIGAQQIKLSQDQVQIVGQERNIASMRFDHTESVVNFLANKFLNTELYEWMSEMLGNVYSFFLQQAAATAQLAAMQLRLERQEPVPAIILTDYWDTSENGLNGSDFNETQDRRGLTGSARLLQDIHKLDQIAFQTDRRKLELKKTISLSQLSPAEFQQFRETGFFRFYTPLEMFDRDFPGHYLRMIKQVKVSILALTIPTDGIRATLSSNGISRIVLSNDQKFIETQIRRSPDSIALSSPLNATGLFELLPDNSKLLPFESMGVDTFWELEMPKASNQFDYGTIADVLLTIEYTAIHSNEYRQQVIERLDRSFSGDRAFSFRHELADQWYDLNNPDLTDNPMTVQFETSRADFPPNLEDLKIRQAVLYFSRKDGMDFEVDVRHLKFTSAESGVQYGENGQNIQSIDGILSTRSGNMAAWDNFISGDKSPLGNWELSLADSEELRNQFKEEMIENILFVITYEGLTPEWPE